jgi:hypothetical protein
VVAVGGGVGLRAYQLPDPFFQGAIVKADEQVFYAPGKYREELIGPIKEMFAPGAPKPKNLHVPDALMSLPSWTEANGRLVFRYDVEIGLPILIKPPVGEGEPVLVPVIVSAWIFVSCPAEALASGEATDWRVEKLELVRGRKPEGGAQRPGGPGRQTAPPPMAPPK